MAKEITARGTVKTDDKGRYMLDIPNPTFWQGELSRFEPGTAVVVSVKKWYKKRSIRQNAVLHWYINEIADETGMAADTIKEVLRHKFLSVDAVDRKGEVMADKESGEVLKVYRSTTELTTFEFMEFTEQIRLWANDFLNLNLPLPNEETELNFTK